MSENLKFLFLFKKSSSSRFIIFLGLVLLTSEIHSQDSLAKKNVVHRVSTNVSVTRFDIFHSFEYSTKIKRFQVNTGLGYGINRSFFQQRFFPKVNVQGVYNLIEKPKFSLGPSLQYSFSWLRINRSSNYFNNWNEVFGGIHWEYGKKWKIGQTISAGYFSESYFNQFLNRKEKAGNWGYFINLSLIYEL